MNGSEDVQRGTGNSNDSRSKLRQRSLSQYLPGHHVHLVPDNGEPGQSMRAPCLSRSKAWSSDDIFFTARSRTFILVFSNPLQNAGLSMKPGGS